MINQLEKAAKIILPLSTRLDFFVYVTIEQIIIIEVDKRIKLFYHETKEIYKKK